MTTNEMILKTLKTRTTREPKYKSILEDMGYVVTDDICYAENHWAVINQQTGKNLALWKDYLNHLTICMNHMYNYKTGDYRKIDFVGYLKCDRRRESNEPRQSKYHEAFINLYHLKNSCKRQERYIEEAKRKVDEAMARLEREIKYFNEYNERIEEIRKNMNEWRKTAG